MFKSLKQPRTLVGLTLFAASAAMLPACDDSDDPADAVEDAADDAGDAIEDAADEVEDAIDP